MTDEASAVIRNPFRLLRCDDLGRCIEPERLVHVDLKRRGFGRRGLGGRRRFAVGPLGGLTANLLRSASGHTQECRR